MTNRKTMQNTINHTRYIVHPYKFNLWLAIVTMVMMFAAFTSAYVVKKSDTANWLIFDLPQMFSYSAVTIVISSVFMQAAYLSFKRNKIYLYRIFIIITFILGASFLCMQLAGWNQLVHSGIKLNGNVAGSFIYVISGAHFVHVVGGVIALLIFSVRAFTKYSSPVDTLLLNIHPDKQIGVELMTTYWHFVGILWIYLFFFFQMS